MKEEETVVYKTHHQEHQERLPESSEVVIASHSHTNNIAHNNNSNNNNNNNNNLSISNRQYKHLRNPVARGLKPSYAASARRVLMDSARGLSRLQASLQDIVQDSKDSLSSNISSLYVNETFEDGKPCRVQGCPLNPTTRVRQRWASSEHRARAFLDCCSRRGVDRDLDSRL